MASRPLVRAFVKIRPDDEGFKEELERQVDTAAKSAARSGSRGFVRVFAGGVRSGIKDALSADDAAGEGAEAGRKWSRGFRRTAAGSGGGGGGGGGLLAGVLGGAGAALKGGLLAAGAAAGTTFFLGLKTGITQAASNQQALIGFDTLLPGGKDVAAKFFDDLKAFAATTPFELPGLVDNARGLLGVGVAAKDVLPRLTALGNASSALGLDQERFSRVMLAVQQIMSKGKVQTEELLQITEAGIPIFQLLSKATGKPVPELQKMMQQGKLLSKDVLPLLFTQMNKDYGGSMEKQSKTLNGVWSTFKDTLRNALADGVEPLIPILSSAVPAAADATGKAIKVIADGAKVGALSIAGFLAAFRGEGVTSDGPVGFFERLGVAARSAFDALGKGGAGPFAPLVTGLRSLTSTAGPALASLIDPLLEFVRSVAPPVLDAGRQIIAVLGTAFASVGKIIQEDLAPAIRAFLPAIAPVVRFLLGVLGSAVVGALKGVVKVVEGVLKILAGLFNVIAGVLTGNWGRAWQGIKQIASGALKAILGALQVWWNVGILKAFRLGFAGLKVLVTGGWGALKSLFSLAGRATEGIIRGMWALIKLAFTAGIKANVTIMTTLPGLLLKALGKVGTLLFDAGKNILGGLGSGLLAGLKSIAGWIGKIKDAVVGEVKKVFQIRSPSRVFIPLGKNITEGLIVGMSAASPTGIIKAAFGGLPEALGATFGSGFIKAKQLGSKALGALGGLGGGIWDKLFGGGGGGGGGKGIPAGVSRWAGVASQALALAGAPQSWLPSLLRRMQRESGGNPLAINNWDVNAQRGDPSRGLMQTIGGTFSAFAGPFRSRGIYDPLANIYAAIRYTIARYGSGPAGWDRAGGYDSGGLLQPGTTLVQNLTGRPERVLDADQTAMLEDWLQGSGSGAVDIEALAEAIVAAFARAGIAVMLDGQVLGQLVDKRIGRAARGARSRGGDL